MAKRIAIIGGGAAGFFTAINAAENNKELDITIYEASNKLLAKVLVSGGGRCNVTNVISNPSELIKNYPRGHDFLEPVFNQFTSDDTQRWFTERGVPLKIEEDGRVFPLSNTSKSIYDCLTQSANKLGVEVKLNHRLKGLYRQDTNWKLKFSEKEEFYDSVVLATGSNKQIHNLLENLNVPIVSAVPSLFTFNASNHKLLELAGVSTIKATTAIKEIKGTQQSGPILVTHSGYSAPAVLKLSAWSARELATLNYKFHLVINWDSYNPNLLKESFLDFQSTKPKDKVMSWKEHNLPKRLWQFLVMEAGLKEYTNWSEIGKKGIVRLVNSLCNFEVKIDGKSTFKEEFVTAGGIDLDAIDVTSFAVKGHPNLFAVGELLDIDAVTGGFNFQAAWSGAYTVSKVL